MRFGYFSCIYPANTKVILDRFVLIMTVAGMILPLICQHINSHGSSDQTLDHMSMSHVDICTTAESPS